MTLGLTVDLVEILSIKEGQLGFQGRRYEVSFTFFCWGSGGPPQFAHLVVREQLLTTGELCDVERLG